METKELAKKESWPSLFENRGWLDRFFNAPLDEYFDFGKVVNIPSVNVSESKEQYALSVAAPGLDKKDIHVQVDGDMITISAEKERKEETNGKYNRREYNYSSWSRSFTIPEDADQSKIRAEYKNGELKIDLPRTGKKLPKNVKAITVN
jgi:HSP20 family protein